MGDIEEKIASTEKRLKQLKAQKEALEARKVQALIKGKRADDTRRKILAGSLALELMSKDEGAKSRFMKQLDTYLTRNDDRTLFDLPALKKEE